MVISLKNHVKLTALEKRVLLLVLRIPKGRIATYQILAKKVGKPKASRVIGNALNKNPYLFKIPCHRIIRSNGQLGGYRLGQNKKIKLLRQEGLEIQGDRIINFEKFLYKF